MSDDRFRCMSAIPVMLCCLFFSEPGFEGRFDRVALKPEGAPDLEVFDDFNGDGRVDILLGAGRTFSVFLNEKGTFHAAPSFRKEAPAEAVFIDVADLDDDGCKEPVFLSRRGVSRFQRFEAGSEDACSAVMKQENSFLPPSVVMPVFLDFIHDMTGDGTEDFLLPELGLFKIYQGVPKGIGDLWGQVPYGLQSDFYTEVMSQTGRLKEVVHVPEIFTGGEGENRIMVLFDGSKITLFRKSPTGAVEFVSEQTLYSPDPRAYEEDSRSYFGKNAFLEDLDGDGFHRLIIADNREGQVDFMKGGTENAPFATDLTIKTGGWILKPVFADLNQDGRKDLILPSIEKIGVFTILRIFFTSRFDIQYMIFFNRKTPLFGLQPDISRRLSLPLSFTAGPEGIQIRHSLIYSFRGDFDGNGINDFLLKSGPRELGLYLGRAGGDFPDEPDFTLPFEPLTNCTSAVTRIYDFNGDGRSDIYLHQKAIGEKADRYDLFLSRP